MDLDTAIGLLADPITFDAIVNKLVNNLGFTLQSDDGSTSTYIRDNYIVTCTNGNNKSWILERVENNIVGKIFDGVFGVTIIEYIAFTEIN